MSENRCLVMDFKQIYGANIDNELRVKNSALYKRDYTADLRDAKQREIAFEHFEYVRKVRATPERYADTY